MPLMRMDESMDWQVAGETGPGQTPPREGPTPAAAWCNTSCPSQGIVTVWELAFCPPCELSDAAALRQQQSAKLDGALAKLVDFSQC